MSECKEGCPCGQHKPEPRVLLVEEPIPGHPSCTMEPKKKPVIVGKLSDAKDHGVAGIVGCAGCASTQGTLEGKTFRCETATCKYRRKPAPRSPWTK